MRWPTFILVVLFLTVSAAAWAVEAPTQDPASMREQAEVPLDAKTQARAPLSAQTQAALNAQTQAQAALDAQTQAPLHAVDHVTDTVREIERPHTLAQLGLGFITIPDADVCLQSRACTKGDTSLAIDFWQMYRANRFFAIGAGVLLALRPTEDNPTENNSGINRTHTRSYFGVEAQVRFYALRLALIELWLGGTAGGVILSDRYTIANSDRSGPEPAILGPRASTIRTEGLSVGGLLGGQWTFATNWAVGATFRYLRWFLPDTPATTSFRDQATLTGQQGVLYVGLLCSYRIAL